MATPLSNTPVVDASHGVTERGQTTEKPERSTDINDLSDILAASGVDIREEENYLAETYRNTQASSSLSSGKLLPSLTVSTHLSLTSPSLQAGNGLPSSLNNYAYANIDAQSNGILGNGSIDLARNSEYDSHKLAARDQSSAQQYHLSDPFLQLNTLRNRIDKFSQRNGVRLNLTGVRSRIAPISQSTNSPTRDTMSNTNSRIQYIVDHNSALADIMSLISLATQERLRNLLEDAFCFARGRAYGSDGIVPPVWSDLSYGLSSPIQCIGINASVTRSSWDLYDTNDAIDSSKLRDSTPHPRNDNGKELVTKSYTSVVASALRAIHARDRAFEDARIAARKKRRKLGNSSAGTVDVNSTGSAIDGSVSSNSSTTEISATKSGGKLASDSVTSGGKMSRKEREKVAKSGTNLDELQHKYANMTASMALGGGRKYSWMVSGASSLSRFGNNIRGSSASLSSPSTVNATSTLISTTIDTSATAATSPGTTEFNSDKGTNESFSSTTRNGLTGSQVSGHGSVNAPGGIQSDITPKNVKASGTTPTMTTIPRITEPLKSNVHRRPQIGEWKESNDKATGIQMRDWLAALELDGREKKALARANVIGLESNFLT